MWRLLCECSAVGICPNYLPEDPTEPINRSASHVQLAGQTGCAPGATSQGIEHAQLDPRIQHLAPPSAENQVDDLCAGVIHGALIDPDVPIETPSQAMFIPFLRGTAWSPTERECQFL